jgi:hypothetical protein
MGRCAPPPPARPPLPAVMGPPLRGDACVSAKVDQRAGQHTEHPQDGTCGTELRALLMAIVGRTRAD